MAPRDPRTQPGTGRLPDGSFRNYRDRESTQRLQCSSFLVMTCLPLRDDNILPKKGTTSEPLGRLAQPTQGAYLALTRFRGSSGRKMGSTRTLTSYPSRNLSRARASMIWTLVLLGRILLGSVSPLVRHRESVLRARTPGESISRHDVLHNHVPETIQKPRL